MINTVGDLLAIKRPEDLYPGDLDKAKQLYRQLSRQWHPDLPTGNHVIFSHISILYKQTLDKLAAGTWEGSAVLNFTDAKGEKLVFTIRSSAPFEYGQSLVGDDHASYLVEAQYRNTVMDLGWHTCLHYANDRMKQEFARYLPQQMSQYLLDDGRCLLRIEKTDDLIRLRDVVTHMGGLDSRHIAWIVSGLLNLSCYLTYTGVVHHDISPDTYFISPKHHSGALLGGWWWAVERNGRLRTLPKRTYSIMPFAARMFKRSSTLTDLELVRLTALECVTAPIPEPMQTWLKNPGSTGAVEQYKGWMEVLEKTFGKRRFINLSIDADTVYTTKVKPNGK